MAKPTKFARRGSTYGFYAEMRDVGYSVDRGNKPGRGEADRSAEKLPSWKKPKKTTADRTDQAILRRGANKGRAGNRSKRRGRLETFVADEATEARLSTTIRHKEFK